MSLRLAFIGLATVVGLAGCWLLYKGVLAAGLLTILAGLAGIALELILQRRDRLRDEAEQQAWIAEIERVADELSLDGYGIASLAELARYHDAAGRKAVLAALAALPAGNRALLAAARQVEPDAEWD